METHESVNACYSTPVDPSIAAASGDLDLSESRLTEQSLDETLEGSRSEFLRQDGVELLLPFLFLRNLGWNGAFGICLRGFLLVERSDRANNVLWVDLLCFLRLCRESPDASCRIFQETVLLQVGASPSEAIGDLCLVAFLWVVELRKDIIWQLLDLDDFVVDLFNGT